MNIRIAQNEDFSLIAQLHINSLKSGFLSKLGVSFLKKLYKSINDQNGSIVIVSETKEGICGFIAGTANTGHLYKSVLIKNWSIFIIPLLKFMFSFKVLVKMLETAAYGLKRKNKHKQNSPSAELLSITVADSMRGKGIGKELIKALEKYFYKSGIKKYKVVTFSEDKQANSFYTSCQFSPIQQFTHHKNIMLIYSKDIL